MEAEIGRGRLSNSQVTLYGHQSVLILNQNGAPCAAARRDSPSPPLQKSLHVKGIEEQSAGPHLSRLSPVPDLILLRPIFEAGQIRCYRSDLWRGATGKDLFARVTRYQILRVTAELSVRRLQDIQIFEVSHTNAAPMS